MANLIFEPGDKNTDISTTVQGKKGICEYMINRENNGISFHLCLIADQAEVGTFLAALNTATVQSLI